MVLSPVLTPHYRLRLPARIVRFKSNIRSKLLGCFLPASQFKVEPDKSIHHQSDISLGFLFGVSPSAFVTYSTFQFRPGSAVPLNRSAPSTFAIRPLHRTTKYRDIFIRLSPDQSEQNRQQLPFDIHAVHILSSCCTYNIPTMHIVLAITLRLTQTDAMRFQCSTSPSAVSHHGALWRWNTPCTYDRDK